MKKSPRIFSAEFKTQVVLEALTGTKSVTEICRQYNITSSVFYRWKTDFLEHASLVFQRNQPQESTQVRIAELERLVERLTKERKRLEQLANSENSNKTV